MLSPSDLLGPISINYIKNHLLPKKLMITSTCLLIIACWCLMVHFEHVCKKNKIGPVQLKTHWSSVFLTHTFNPKLAIMVMNDIAVWFTAPPPQDHTEMTRSYIWTTYPWQTSPFVSTPLVYEDSLKSPHVAGPVSIETSTHNLIDPLKEDNEVEYKRPQRTVKLNNEKESHFSLIQIYHSILYVMELHTNLFTNLLLLPTYSLRFIFGLFGGISFPLLFLIYLLRKHNKEALVVLSSSLTSLKLLIHSTQSINAQLKSTTDQSSLKQTLQFYDQHTQIIEIMCERCTLLGSSSSVTLQLLRQAASRVGTSDPIYFVYLSASQLKYSITQSKRDYHRCVKIYQALENQRARWGIALNGLRQLPDQFAKELSIGWDSRAAVLMERLSGIPAHPQQLDLYLSGIQAAEYLHKTGDARGERILKALLNSPLYVCRVYASRALQKGDYNEKSPPSSSPVNPSRRTFKDA